MSVARVSAFARRVSPFATRCPHRALTTAAPAKVNMALVKQLRDASGAPITECKDAVSAAMTAATVTDTAALLAAATDILRKKGISTANKKSGRAASEGLVSVTISADRRHAAVIEINSETDFAARNERFQSMVAKISETITKYSSSQSSKPLLAQSNSLNHSNDIDLASVNAVPSDSGTIQSLITDTVTSLRENLQLRRVASLSVSQNGIIGVYVHNALPVTGTSPDTKLGRTATVVGLEYTPSNNDGQLPSSALIDLANKLAMQITAAAPKFLTIASIPADVVEHERTVLAEQMKASGKPIDPKHISKVIDGRLNKFYEDVAFTEQKVVVNTGDDKPAKVSQFLADQGKKLQGAVKVTGFAKFVVGEGVTRSENKMSFAEEVASKLKQS